MDIQRRPFRHRSRAEDLEIALLYRQGATIPELERSFGRSSGTIKAALERMQVPLRRPGPRRRQVQDQERWLVPPDIHLRCQDCESENVIVIIDVPATE